MLVSSPSSPRPERDSILNATGPKSHYLIHGRSTTTTCRAKFSALLTEIKCLAILVSLSLLFQHIKSNNLASLLSFIEMITMPMD